MKRLTLLWVFLMCIVVSTVAADLTSGKLAISQYKTSDQCKINITGALTAADVRTIRAEIDAKGYTNFNISTLNGYQLSEADMILLCRQYEVFAPECDEKNGCSGDYFPSLLPIWKTQTLSLKDAEIVKGTNYGSFLGHLLGLKNLVCSKTAEGPNMANSKAPLETVTIPKIGADGKKGATIGLFTGITTLTSVDFNTCAVGDIPASCCDGCTNLSKVKIMSTGLTRVGNAAFRNCTSLTKISFPAGITSIGNQAFAWCGIKNLIFPSTLETIEEQAFLGLSELRTLRIPGNVKYIANQAFASCTNIDNVYVMGKSTKAANHAFAGNMNCTNFKYDGDHEGTFSKNHWTTTVHTVGLDASCEHPILLHIPAGTEMQYLNPYIIFINNIDGKGALQELVDIYKNSTTPKEQDASNDQAVKDWYNKWIADYPAIVSYQWNIYKYMDAKYHKQLDESEYNKLRVWEEDENGFRYASADECNQFNGPLTLDKTNGNYEYAGWNNFLLAVNDATTARDSIALPANRFTDSRWYSICVPYPMSRTQVEETFGTTTEVCEFKRVVTSLDEEGEEQTTFFFDEDAVDNGNTYMIASHPYMIRPSKVAEGNENPHRVLYDVTAEQMNSYISNNQNEDRLKAEAVHVDYYDETDPNNITTITDAFYFKGNYEESNIVSKGTYYWGNGGNTDETLGFYHMAVDGSKWNRKPTWTMYTAIVFPTSTDPTLGSKAKMHIMDWEDFFTNNASVVTGIGNVERSTTSDSRYNLAGQRVGKDYKGIVIISGKKYLIK